VEVFFLKKSLLIITAILLIWAVPAFAVFPDGKPIHVYNPYSAGGTSDVEIRAVAPLLEEYLGVPIVVESLTGAGGRICAAKMYKAEPDGHTLYYNNMPASNIGEALYDGNYKTGEFVYLANVVKENRLIAVRPDSPYETLEDLYKASEQEDLTCAVSGLGTSGHFGSILLNEIGGLKHSVVPFAGSSKAKAAFLGGHVDFWTPGSGRISQLVDEGKIRLLAVMAPERVDAYPSVPTVAELGYPEVNVYTARGFNAPPGLPDDIKATLIEALEKAITNQKTLEWAEKVSRPIFPVTGDEYYELYQETEELVQKFLPVMQESISK